MGTHEAVIIDTRECEMITEMLEGYGIIETRENKVVIRTREMQAITETCKS